MAKIRLFGIEEAGAAIERIAQYYRQSRLYLHESNSTDAYDFFIRTYSNDLELIIQQGLSYTFKGNYLVACDVEKFYEEYPEEAEHFFGCVPQIKSSVERENVKALFICAFGPAKDIIGRDGYALIETFVKMYDDYVILTDCPTGYDIDQFHKHTTSSRIRIAGREAWRWS